MKWRLHRWTWLLESPLFVGHLPSGALNRCRLYVPARAMWGAVTAEVARRTSRGFPDYRQIGSELEKCARFTCLFPAEQIDGRWVAWLPIFETGRGLCWKREDDVGDVVQDRVFRRRLLTTRPGTAIDPTSYVAADGSLRETECVAERWRTEQGRGGVAGRVAFVGYIFTAGQAANRVRGIDRIFIGGDTRYGLGSMKRVVLEQAQRVFGELVTLNGSEPVIRTARVLGHAQAVDPLWGAKELLHGRRYGAGLQRVAEDVAWVPGSRDAAALEWTIDGYGIWVTVQPAGGSRGAGSSVNRTGFTGDSNL